MSIQNEESQVEVVQPETEVKEEAVETEKEEVQVENPEILALKTEVQECKEQVLRAQAELQNMRRRCEQDIEKAKKFAIDRFVDALLPVLDPLEKSVQYMDRENEQIKPL